MKTEVSDFFVSTGGAADDQNDCTAAFNAGMQKLAADGGGTLRLAKGISRVFAKVEHAPYAPITIEGDGDGVVRLKEFADRRFSVGSQQGTATWRNITMLGVDGEMYQSPQSCLYFGGHRANIEKSRFYGLGVSGGGVGDFGIVIIGGSSNAVVTQSQFNGCTAPNTGVLRGRDVVSLSVSHCEFLDYVSYNNHFYNKTSNGVHAWIELVDPRMQGTTKISKYKFEQIDFDEGASRAVIVKGAAAAEFDRININVGTVCGLELEDVDQVTIRNSWMGYNTNGDKCGALFHNCGRVDIDNLQFTEGVRYIEITGTTKEVHINNSKLQGTTAIPDGIKNTAGARIFVNGSPYD